MKGTGQSFAAGITCGQPWDETCGGCLRGKRDGEEIRLKPSEMLIEDLNKTSWAQPVLEHSFPVQRQKKKGSQLSVVSGYSLYWSLFLNYVIPVQSIAGIPCGRTNLESCSHQVRVDLCQLNKAGITDRCNLKTRVLQPESDESFVWRSGRKLAPTTVKRIKNHRRLVDLH